MPACCSSLRALSAKLNLGKHPLHHRLVRIHFFPQDVGNGDRRLTRHRLQHPRDVLLAARLEILHPQPDASQDQGEDDDERDDDGNLHNAPSGDRCRADLRVTPMPGPADDMLADLHDGLEHRTRGS